MKTLPRLRHALAAIGAALAAVSTSSASDLYWSGAGNWDTTNQVWGTVSGGPYDQAIWNNLNNDTAVFQGTAGTVTLQEAITVGGITFNTAGYVIAGNTLTLASGAIIHSTVGTSNTTDPVITSALAGTNGFTKTGSGWLGLESTTSSLSGDINIAGGTLYARSEALGDADLVFTGNATFTKVYNASKDFSANITINSGVTATMNAASFYYDSFHSGVLAGDSTTTLNLSIGGNSELEFRNNNNTFTGTLSITGPGIDPTSTKAAEFNSLADSDQQILLNNALLRLRNGGVSMNFASRQLVLNNQSGALDNDSTNAGVTMSFSQDLLANIGNNGRTFRLGGVNAGDNAFSGVIGNSANGSGVVSLEKWEAGKWILGDNNTYTGKTTVRTGTLEVASLKNLDTASSVGMNNILQLGYFNTAGTLRYVGAGDTTDRPIQINDYTSGTGNSASGIIINDGTGALTFTASEFITTNEIAVANRSLELGGSYTGAANEIQGIIQDIAPIANKAIISVIKRDDASTWSLSGANTYTGTTTISGGTLEVGGGGTLGNVSAGVGNYAGNISIASTNSGTLRFNSSATQTLGGVISGTGALVKDNSGTLTLTGVNSYSGATTVSGGTLEVSGTGEINATSGITIAAGAEFKYNSSTALGVGITNNGGTISGGGTIGVAVNLDSTDDVLAPGNSPGIQTYGVSQTWSSFTYAWETNDFTGTTAGTDFDQIAILGDLTLTGLAAGSYVLDLISLTAGNDSGLVPNFSEVNRSWDLLTTTGTISGFDADFWTIDTSAFTSSPTWAGTWSLGVNGSNNALVLNYVTAIPEPGVALLGGLGLLALLRRRRA